MSYYAGIQAQITASSGYIGTFCNFPSGAYTDIQCTDIYGISGMDNEGLNNYVGDSKGNSNDAYFDGKYTGSLETFKQYSLCRLVDNTTIVDYDYPEKTQNIIYSFTNPLDLLPHIIKTTNSMGDTLIHHIFYPKDFPSMGGTTAVSSVPTDPVEDISTIKKTSGNELVTGANLITYKTSGSNSSIDRTYTYNSSGILIPYTSFTLFDGSSSMDSHYEERKNNQLYDATGNLNQFTDNAKVTTVLWGYNHELPIAKFNNASLSDVAHSCFESGDPGNWTIPAIDLPNKINIGYMSTYSLANAGSTGITKAGLDPSKTYILSYWTTRNPYPVTGTQGSILSYHMGGYYFYIHHITGVTNIKIAGTGLIAELSIYPSNAKMQTFTYSPLQGVLSKTDPSGRVEHFDYDGLGRLTKQWGEYIYLQKVYDYKYKIPVNP